MDIKQEKVNQKIQGMSVVAKWERFTNPIEVVSNNELNTAALELKSCLANKYVNNTTLVPIKADKTLESTMTIVCCVVLSKDKILFRVFAGSTENRITW